MPLMGSLYIGNSGLTTSQNALNTTAHNISNADTTGYVRQQVLQSTSIYNTINVNYKAVSSQQIGLGVTYAKTRQVRDYFLDQTYRRESGRSAFYEVSSDALGEVENLLDEMNGESFQDSIKDLWTAVQELAKDPGSAVTQGLLVERCSEFLSRSQSVYNGLITYQSNLNDTVKSKVDTINDYAKKIKELNDEIRYIEAGGFESANDLRDARNQLVDELSAMANINYSEDIDGSVCIQLEGEDLVKRDVVYQILLDTDPKTGFYTPFWEQNAKFTLDENGKRQYDSTGAEVFDLNKIISSDLNTDIGSLKSAILARGDHIANYTDLTTENYDNSVSQSVVMNIQAEFDQLIHNITTTMNDILYQNADPKTGYLCNSDGSPIQIFQKIASEPYLKDANGNYQLNADGKPIRAEEDEDVIESLYTTSNLIINQQLLQQPTRLGFVKADGSVDFDTMAQIKAAFTAENSTLNPNVKKKSSFVDYYSDLVSQVANSGAVYKSIVSNQQETVDATFSAREQIVGVSQDEELTNMVKFQNAYNAASRYINVVDDMLEHIINTLAV